jgi:hypothetical protein
MYIILNVIGFFGLCSRGGIGRHVRFRFLWQFLLWGFESPRLHHFIKNMCVLVCVKKNLKGFKGLKNDY